MADPFEEVEELCDAYLEEVWRRLSSQELVPCSQIERDKIPEEAGIYEFSPNNEGKAYYGETDNFRRRIWKNHIAGKQRNSTFRRGTISPEINSEDEGAISDAIREGYSARWLPLKLGRKEAETYVKNQQEIKIQRLAALHRIQERRNSYIVTGKETDSLTLLREDRDR